MNNGPSNLEPGFTYIDYGEATSTSATNRDWESECKRLTDENNKLKAELDYYKGCIEDWREENERLKLIVKTVEAVTGMSLLENLYCRVIQMRSDPHVPFDI